MNMLPNQSLSIREKPISDDDELLSALEALQPGEQQQKNTLFSKAYPGILRAMARKVTQKNILHTLSRSGLKLHPIRFRTMLEAESKLRNEHGEHISCVACGSVLQLPQDDESFSARESVNQTGQLDNSTQS